MEMKGLREEQWSKFCNSINNAPKYSSEHWKKIKQITSQGNQSSETYKKIYT